MYWCLLGEYQIGGEGSGNSMGNGWRWFLGAWYEPTFCDLEKAVFKIRECDTIL